MMRVAEETMLCSISEDKFEALKLDVWFEAERKLPSFRERYLLHMVP
jgi:hypothetical protein